MDSQPQSDDWYSAEASTFGDRVAGARERMGMTRQDLAKRLGVKVSTVEHWEDDVSEPRANKLQLLAGILNVSLTWLLMAEGDGIQGPEDSGPAREEVEPLLTEMRHIRSELLSFTNRLTVLEKRLRRALKEEG